MRKNVATRIEANIEDKKAFIRIVDYIGSYSSSSVSLRETVDGLISKGANSAEVYISSQGGQVFEAVEMVNELKKFKKVVIKVGALAASAATYITSSFFTIANKSSQFMIHKPSLSTSGTVEDIKSDLKLLENLTQEFLTVYAKKTQKTEDDIKQLWSKGDYWMTANEALSLGFVDEISLDDERHEELEEESMLLEACGAPLTEELKEVINKQKNKQKMEKFVMVLAAALGMSADATEQDILAVVKDNKEKAESYEDQRKSIQELTKLKAEGLIERAIASKKITVAQKEHYVKLAIADYESVASVLDSTAVIPQLSNSLDPGSLSSRSGWTIEDYLDKDPEALKVMAKEQPDVYAELEKKYLNN